MNEQKFSYLVERLYRAGLRMSAATSEQEKLLARRWLARWNTALRREHARRQHRHQP